MPSLHATRAAVPSGVNATSLVIAFAEVKVGVAAARSMAQRRSVASAAPELRRFPSASNQRKLTVAA
jgi:hypothetical protein